MLKVPSSVIRNARKGLELRKFYGRGGTEVGEASAKKLASGFISEAFAKHVAQYFPRHAGDLLEQTEASSKGPSNGYIAWLLWGGNEARDWLAKKLEEKTTMSKAKTKNPFFMDAFHAGEAFQKDKSANRTPRYASFAEWWKFKGSKDIGAKTFDSEDAKDFWIMGVNSAKKSSPSKKNPARKYEKVLGLGSYRTVLTLPSGKKWLYLSDSASQAERRAKEVGGVYIPNKRKASNPSLPPNASAQQINTKLKQLSHLKAALENKGTRKDFVKAERIAQQMKALALKHQKALQLPSSSKAKNPSLKRGLKAIGKTVGGKVSSMAKRITRKAKASLRKLTPSGRRSTAAIKRLQEASKGDPLGKTKRMILDARKASRNPMEDDYGAFNAGKQWITSGKAAESGVANARLSSYGFSKWWNSLSPSQNKNKTKHYQWFLEGVAAGKRLSKKNPKKRKPSAKPIARKRKRNSAAASSALYEQFHGKPSTSILEIEEEWHIHKNLAQLGTLVEIKVLLNPTESKSNQRRATLAVPHSDNVLKGVQLCSSEGKGPKTLYLIGGDQSLPLKALGFTSADEKDLMYIGEIEEITYRTRKHFDQFKKIDYYHGLGEVSKVRPQLLYRLRDKKLLIAGGQYDVRPEGIVN